MGRPISNNLFFNKTYANESHQQLYFTSAWIPGSVGPVNFTTSATAVSVGNGGASYNSGDVGKVLTVIGGVSTTAAQLTITSVGGGLVTGISVTTAGLYTSAPVNAVSVSGSTTGTGATFLLTLTANSTAYPIRQIGNSTFIATDGVNQGIVKLVNGPGPVTASGQAIIAVNPYGVGSGAIVDAALGGALVGFIGIVGGSLYSGTPTVSFYGGGGPTATANLTTNTVTSITINTKGGGYTSIPTVVISGGGGTSASYTADLGVEEGSILVASGGSSYVAGDVGSVLTLTGGTGTQATLKITQVSAGKVTGVSVLSSGSYSALPSNPVSIGSASPATTGSGATFTLKYKVVAFTQSAVGSGYTTVPTVSFSGGGQAAGTAVLTAEALTSITITGAGTQYTSAPTVVISGGSGSGAAATAVVSSFVRLVNVVSGGSGYQYPAVIFGSTAGSNAAATASLGNNGSILSVAVTSTGGNYNGFVPVSIVDTVAGASTQYLSKLTNTKVYTFQDGVYQWVNGTPVSGQAGIQFS